MSQKYLQEYFTSTRVLVSIASHLECCTFEQNNVYLCAIYLSKGFCWNVLFGTCFLAPQPPSSNIEIVKGEQN